MSEPEETNADEPEAQEGEAPAEPGAQAAKRGFGSRLAAWLREGDEEEAEGEEEVEAAAEPETWAPAVETVEPEEIEVEVEAEVVEPVAATARRGLVGWLSSLSTRALFALLFGVFAAVLLAVLFGVLAAVGGKSTQTGTVHQLAKVQRCLEKQGAAVSLTIPADQVIARTALGGALLAHIKGNTLILMFAGSEQAALNLFLAQEDAAPPRLQAHLGDILFRQDDVVALWALGPLTEQSNVLTTCLR